MAQNTSKEIFSISATKIKEDLRRAAQYERTRSQALIILALYLKEECLRNAYRLPDLTKYAKRLLNLVIPEILKEYLELTKPSRLSYDVRNLVIKTKGSAYESFELRENWKFTRKMYGWFPRKFFYYDEPDFANPYTIPDEDLPLYVNKKWKSAIEEIIYKERYSSYSTRLCTETVEVV